jgi:hypothetical protein
LSSSWLTFSGVSVDSSKAHPLRCGSWPNVGQSALALLLAGKEKAHTSIMNTTAFQAAFIESPWLLE